MLNVNAKSHLYADCRYGPLIIRIVFKKFLLCNITFTNSQMSKPSSGNVADESLKFINVYAWKNEYHTVWDHWRLKCQCASLSN